MVDKGFKVDDLVWAKMKGYSPWPGKIMVPPPEAKSKPKKYHHCVFFFGSNNHAWIPDENIVLHSEKMVKKFNNKKAGLYQTAIDTIIETSKGISKYHRATGNSEMPDSKSTSKSKEQENRFDKSDNSDSKSKTKSLQSNSSTPKKLKKKIPMKKSSVKKLSRKRSHSFDQSKPDSDSMNFAIEDIYSPKNLRLDDQYAELMSNVPPNLSYNIDGVSSSTPSAPGVINRKYFDRPDTPPIDITYQKEIFKKKKIQPTNKKIGFLGLGRISQGIVKNLYHSGHSIIIWNQTPNECEDFREKFDLTVAATPADVIEAADVTFSCVSDEDTAKQLVFGNCGILKELEHRNGERKGYVEMTCMDPKTSEAIGREIQGRGGRYLEAPLSGSRMDADEGTLSILAAGDESLYEDCKSCFEAVSRRHKFVCTEVGTAAKFNIVYTMLVETFHATLAEALGLVTRLGVNGDFLDSVKEINIFDLLLKDPGVNNDNIVEKAKKLSNDLFFNLKLAKIKSMGQLLY